MHDVVSMCCRQSKPQSWLRKGMSTHNHTHQLPSLGEKNEWERDSS